MPSFPRSTVLSAKTFADIFLNSAQYSECAASISCSVPREFAKIPIGSSLSRSMLFAYGVRNVAIIGISEEMRPSGRSTAHFGTVVSSTVRFVP